MSTIDELSVRLVEAALADTTARPPRSAAKGEGSSRTTNAYLRPAAAAAAATARPRSTAISALGDVLSRALPTVATFATSTTLFVLSRLWKDLLTVHVLSLDPPPYCGADAPPSLPCTPDAPLWAMTLFALVVLIAACAIQVASAGHLSTWPNLRLVPRMTGMGVAWVFGDVWTRLMKGLERGDWSGGRACSACVALNVGAAAALTLASAWLLHTLLGILRTYRPDLLRPSLPPRAAGGGSEDGIALSHWCASAEGAEGGWRGADSLTVGAASDPAVETDYVLADDDYSASMRPRPLFTIGTPSSTVETPPRGMSSGAPSQTPGTGGTVLDGLTVRAQLPREATPPATPGEASTYDRAPLSPPPSPSPGPSALLPAAVTLASAEGAHPALRFGAHAISFTVMQAWSYASRALIASEITSVTAATRSRLLLYWATSLTFASAIAVVRLVALRGALSSRIALGDHRQRAIPLMLEMTHLIEGSCGLVVGMAWVDWFAHSTALVEYPTATVIWADGGYTLLLTLVGFAWLALTGQGASLAEELKRDRGEVERFFFSNALSYLVGYSWIVLARDISTFVGHGTPGVPARRPLGEAIVLLLFAPMTTYALIVVGSRRSLAAAWLLAARRLQRKIMGGQGS